MRKKPLNVIGRSLLNYLTKKGYLEKPILLGVIVNLMEKYFGLYEKYKRKMVMRWLLRRGIEVDVVPPSQRESFKHKVWRV